MYASLLVSVNNREHSAIKVAVLCVCLWVWCLGWSVAAALWWQGEASSGMFALHAAAGPIAWLALWLGTRGHWRTVCVGLIVFILAATAAVGYTRGQYTTASLMNIAVVTLLAGWALGAVAAVVVALLSQALLVFLVQLGVFSWSQLLPMMFTCLFLGAVTVIARRAYERHMQQINNSLNTLSDQQQRLKLLTSVVEQSPFSLLVDDLAGRVVYANPAFLNHSGYDESEVLGHPSLKVSLTGMDAEAQASMRKVLEAGGAWRGVLRNALKDGQLVAENVTITPVSDAQGALRYMVEIKQDITAQLFAQERISQLMNFDPLTQLPNRFALARKLDELLQAQGSEQPEHDSHGPPVLHGLLLLDLDRFDKFNMARGSAWGDALLSALGLKLASVVGEDAWVARYTDDQFAVVLESIGYSRSEARLQAYSVAMVVQSALTHVTVLDGQDSVATSFGIGMTVFPFIEPGLRADGSDHILRRAAVALAHAKRQGLGQTQAYSETLSESAQRNVQLESELSVALEQGQLRLFVQPQYDMEGQVVSMEALVRWQHPEQGMISPGEFIPVAEESGQIVAIGAWVLEQVGALLNVPRMRECGYSVAVNISARQFMQPDFVQQVTAMLERALVPGHLVTLEVTESVVLADVQDAIQKMEVLRGLGLEFSLDDFGTGYSSLSYLQRLPIQEIKVDQSFIQNLDPSGGSGALVQAVLMVAKRLGLRVVAEGVERAEDAHVLQAWEPAILCQGYFFSRPMPVEQWLQGLAQENNPQLIRP